MSANSKEYNHQWYINKTKPRLLVDSEFHLKRLESQRKYDLANREERYEKTKNITK